MTFEQMRDHYENDNLFHTMVDTFYHFLLEGKYTVGEMRDAVTFAGYKFELERVESVWRRK